MSGNILVTQEDQPILPAQIVSNAKKNENVVITTRFYGEDFTVVGKGNGGNIPMKEMNAKGLNFQNSETSANPGPIGLMGFGLTTFLLNLKNVGAFEMNTMILGKAYLYFSFNHYF